MSDWDWENKSQILWRILGARNPTAFAKKAFPSQVADAEGKLLWQKFYDAQRKWKGAHASTPSDETIAEYFPRLSEIIGLERSVGISALLDGKADDLLAKISADVLKGLSPSELAKLRQSATQVTSSQDVTQRSFFTNRTWRSIAFDLRERVQKLVLAEVWGEDGIIAQKFCYLTPEAVHNWRDLVKYDGYQNYVHCRYSLQRFLTSDLWNAVLKEKGLETVAILGVGAGEKAHAIAESVFKSKVYSPQNKLRFLLIDSSLYMIRDDELYLAESPSFADFSRVLQMQSYCFDFLKWPLLRDIAHAKGDGLTAFFILGCTVANIDEHEFLTSVAKSSRAGDLLVIGTEFQDDQNFAQYKRDLRAKYDSNKMKDTTVEPIRYMLDDAGVMMNKESRRKLVQIELDERDDSTLIEKTIAIRSRMSVKDAGDISDILPKDPQDRDQCVEALEELEGLILMTSRRYARQKFISFVEARGFRYLDEFAADYPSYKQIVFERRG